MGTVPFACGEVERIKRKYANHPDWKRIIERDYKQTFLDTTDFQGHVSLLIINKVTDPFYVTNNNEKICLLDNGYSWLQYFPVGKQFSLTSFFDENGQLIQHYIDICCEYLVENDIPFIDDLYVDIVVMPNGEIIILDVDELEEALAQGHITSHLHEIALAETDRLVGLIKEGQLKLLGLAVEHRDYLLNLNLII